MGQIPGHPGRELSREMNDIQSNANSQRGYNARAGPAEYSQTGQFDPEEIARQIYPILAFRDRVVKAISNTIEKVLPPDLYLCGMGMLMVDSWS
jgi:Heterokaryon incompatibility protein Het-C